MHNTNGFLDNSGLEEGSYLSFSPRDRSSPKPSHQAEDSELITLSVAVREKIYGIGAGRQYSKHYIRQIHRCQGCPATFASKAALREHRFELHSY
jgi:hypothetical protein